MRLPTFFILGAARCGTTWLYGQFRDNPDIYMSDPKEPDFFPLEYERGLEYYWSTYFPAWNGEKAVGDGNHRNLYLPYVADRIAESVPEAKLIVSVRHPVDRAHSHWWHDYSRGLIRLSFEDAIDEDLRRIEQGITFGGPDGNKQYVNTRVYTYLDSGFYARQIKRYLEHFNGDRLKVSFLEDVAREPESAMADLSSFLGVRPMVQEVERGLRQESMGRLTMRAIGLTRAASRYVSWPVKSLALRLLYKLNKIGNKPEMSETTRRDLLGIYRPHVADLEKLTGRDLSHWYS